MSLQQAQLTTTQQEGLLQILEERFEQNMHRHANLTWDSIKQRLASNPEKLWSLHQMESTGGEPDVVSFGQQENEYTFYDCAKESPSGRRSLCYDQEALDGRKANKPQNNCISIAQAMGITILNEEQYRKLQAIEPFDLKTSSWIDTTPEIRKHGGAIFCDRRYNHVFTYHNGADSYYAARGFRAFLQI